MQILRVEHIVTHEGPYTSGIHDDYEWCHGTHSGHPTPLNDPEISKSWSIINHKLSYCCGFKDREQLNAWFSPSEQSVLVDEDFVLAVYEIPEDLALVSKHQVVFPIGKAKRISEEELQ